jgi:hypothetical protein
MIMALPPALWERRQWHDIDETSAAGYSTTVDHHVIEQVSASGLGACQRQGPFFQLPWSRISFLLLL